MKIAIFGATGATGKLLTERSLAAGHTVSALVRTPGTFAYAGRVRVVQGDAFNSAAIDETLAGADAVFSALGAPSPFKPGEVLERGIPLIVQAMERAQISRIVVLGSSGALDSALDKQPAWRRWIIEHFIYKALKYPNDSQRAQYAALSASSLDWTMAMPPMLLNVAGRGLQKVRVDGDALPSGGSMIARADVADFMFQQLTSREWIRKGVYITW
jgi:putative NADH-flavin reductase